LSELRTFEWVRWLKPFKESGVQQTPEVLFAERASTQPYACAGSVEKNFSPKGSALKAGLALVGDLAFLILAKIA